HRIASRHKRDRRTLLCSRLKFVERQRRQHLAWISQIRSHPGSAAQCTIQGYRQETVIAAIDLRLCSPQCGLIGGGHLSYLPIACHKVGGHYVIALIHVDYTKITNRGTGFSIIGLAKWGSVQ